MVGAKYITKEQSSTTENAPARSLRSRPPADRLLATSDVWVCKVRGVQQNPKIYGELTTLRPWRDTDLDFALSVALDPLIPLISEIPAEADIEGAQAFITAQDKRFHAGRGWAWAITSRETDAVVGYVGALWIAQPAGRASIGYWTRSAERRSGLISNAVAAAAGWLLADGGVARLEAYIEPWNVGSIRVAKRAGFEEEGLMKSFAPLNGERKDAYLFARVAK